jgi:hypothetical protein
LLVLRRRWLILGRGLLRVLRWRLLILRRGLLLVLRRRLLILSRRLLRILGRGLLVLRRRWLILGRRLLILHRRLLVLHRWWRCRLWNGGLGVLRRNVLWRNARLWWLNVLGLRVLGHAGGADRE